LLIQQTRQNGAIAVLTNTIEMQQKDRADKHTQLMSMIASIHKSFDEHIKEEMDKYDEIKDVQNDTKWKTKVMWAVMTAAGTGIMGLVFWFVREFIEKAN
jgi:hypothetical protein